MAKKIKVEKKIVEPVKEVKEEPKEQPKEEVKKEPVVEFEIADSVTQAEKLQKSGWQLISITQSSSGKQYKFKR